MKTLILAFGILIASVNTISAQSKNALAYAKSYEQEYAQDYNKAIDEMQVIYSENSYDVNLRMGWLNYASGEYLKSKKFYLKAIGLAKKSVEARLGLINVLAALQNWNEVLSTYEEILSIDPNNSNANYQVAVIYFIRKDYSKSESYAMKAHDLYPFDYSSNVLLGKIKIQLGDKATAKKYLHAALNYSPSATEVSDLLKNL